MECYRLPRVLGDGEKFTLRRKSIYIELDAGGVTEEMQKIWCVYPENFNNAGRFFFISVFSNSSLSLWEFQKQSIDYFVQHLACDNWIQPS